MRILKSARNQRIGAVAGLLVSTMVLAACGGGGGTTATAPAAPVEAGTGEGAAAEDIVAQCEANKPAQLTMAVWMDVPPELLERFQEEYGIEVVVNSFPDGASAQTVLRNGLAANGAGLSDVTLIELDWWTEMMAIPEDWMALPAIPGRWVDWKVAQGSVDGKITGYGTDIGPLGIAFNEDMLAEAGLATDPATFAEFIGGSNATWQSFLDAGREYVAVSNNYWIDSLSSAFQAAINLLPDAFEDPATGNPYPMADNVKVHDLFMMFANAAADHVSAGIAIGHNDWGPGFQTRQWATVVTPAWMSGIIAENADGIDGWRISDTFPDGGGNWGGSFFAVPATGPNTACAVLLADFMTSPEAAIETFHLTGQFPSQLEAMASPDISDAENAFFGNQRIGEIYGNLAEQAGESAAGGFRGPNFAGIQQLLTQGIQRVESGAATPEASWEQVVSEFNALGFNTVPYPG